MASSTRIPTAKDRPPNVIRLIVSPNALNTSKELTTANGIDVLLAPDLAIAGDPQQMDATPIINFARTMYDVVILDTAGRTHIDEPLMIEMAEIKAAGAHTNLAVLDASRGRLRLEKLVLEGKAFAGGVDMSANGQAMDAIEEVGPGSHFLGCAHTQAGNATDHNRDFIVRGGWLHIMRFS